MNTNPVDFREKRQIGEITRATFRFIGAEYKQLASLILAYVLPFMVLFATAQVFLQMKITEGAGIMAEMDMEKLMAEASGLYGNVLIIILFNVFVQSLYAALVYSYVKIYIEKGTGNFSSSEIVNNLFSNSLKSLAAAFAVSALILAGILFFIIPGLILALFLCLTLFVTIFEQKNLADSLSRSWNLVRKDWGGTLLLNIFGIIIIWVLGIFISIIIFLFQPGLNSTANVAVGGTIELSSWHWVLSGFSTVITSLAAIIPLLFLAFQYFNLTAKEDKTSLQP